MNVTKYEHACLVLEHEDERLVIDPGNFTRPLPALDKVTAIVITHQHPDHWSDDQLARIRENNPDAPIFGPAGVAASASNWNVTWTLPVDSLGARGPNSKPLSDP